MKALLCHSVLLLSLALGLSSPCKATEYTLQQPWREISLHDVSYVSLQDLLDFYHFQIDSTQSKGEQLHYRNENISLKIDPSTQSLFLDLNNIKLLHPIKRDGRGEILLSKDDCIYMLDPILRPNYIEPRVECKKIIIDIGHNDLLQSMRAQAREEKAKLALTLGKRLKAHLEDRGYEVELTREADYYVSKKQRQYLANKSKNALYLGIRFDDYDPRAQGINSYIADPDENRDCDQANAALGLAINSQLEAINPASGVQLQRTRHHILSGIQIPAVLVSLGNLSNPARREQIHNVLYQEQSVMALVAGIEQFTLALAPLPDLEAEANKALQQEAQAIQALELDGHTEDTEEIQAVEIEED